MSRLDDELRNAFRAEEPPSGFEARLMARVAAERSRRSGREQWTAWFRMPVLRVAFAAVLSLVFVVGVRYEQEERQKAKGEAAKQQLMLALHVTGSTLQAVNEKVRGLSRDDSGSE